MYVILHKNIPTKFKFTRQKNNLNFEEILELRMESFPHPDILSPFGGKSYVVFYKDASNQYKKKLAISLLLIKLYL